ncbi:hypothetical protein C8A03DRAFT_38224 [Achaetomium macrosporum]|uniref:Uncharacterized protein n=1 Tax=Achaetomium macrosporum TaxID=79813 RepID=A0AAN7C284_9PEZI|nr:hypothetical protein C8A03DRAFT_38224 [Achaetomium macrosporum]
MAIPNANDFRAEDIVDRDVVILGGGATGTYAAVQLRQQGHSVALVEQKSRLGGRAETIYLPNGEYVNYGVEGYFNNAITKEFFAQLNVAPLRSRTIPTAAAAGLGFRASEKPWNSQGRGLCKSKQDKGWL